MHSSNAHYYTNSGASFDQSGAPYYVASSNQMSAGAYSARTQVSGSDQYGSGMIWQSADLATGTIKAYLSGTGFAGGVIDTLNDTVTFYNSSGAVADIIVSWTIDGRFALAPQSSSGDVYGKLVLGAGFDYTGHLDSAGNSVNNPGVGNGWVSATYAPAGPYGYTFTGVYALQPGSSQLPFQMVFTMSGTDELATGNTTLDWSHSSSLKLVLPSEVSYTSASGVFLTGSSPSAVPEPQAYALGALGLAALAFLRRLGQRHDV